LKRLGLWLTKKIPSPRANAPPHITETYLDYSHRGAGPYGPEADSQLPPPYDYFYEDEQYSGELSV